MWAVRGAQSAVFYYASCTPCLEFQSRRRLQQQHKRDLAAREAAIARAAPGEYQQPAPFTTNEYWASEIASRPTPWYALAMEAAKQRANYDTPNNKDGAQCRTVPSTTTTTTTAPAPSPSRQVKNKVSHMELQEVCVSSIGSGAKAVAWAERADNRWMLKPPAQPGVMNGRNRPNSANGPDATYVPRKKSAESSSGRDGSSRTEVEIDVGIEEESDEDGSDLVAPESEAGDSTALEGELDDQDSYSAETPRHKKTYSAYF